MVKDDGSPSAVDGMYFYVLSPFFFTSKESPIYIHRWMMTFPGHHSPDHWGLDGHWHIDGNTRQRCTFSCVCLVIALSLHFTHEIESGPVS